MTDRYVAVAPNLPNIPIDVKQCLAGKVKVPQGAWTMQMVADVIAQYRRRENKLEGCLANVEAFYVDLQRGLAKKR